MRVFLIYFLFLMTVSSPGTAQEVHELNPKYPVHDLDPYLRVFEDPKGERTPREMLLDSALDGMRGDQLPRYLKIGEVYWGRLVVRATDSLTGWTLQFEDKMLGPPAWAKSNGAVDVYGFAGTQEIFHKQTGVEVARRSRETPFTGP